MKTLTFFSALLLLAACTRNVTAQCQAARMAGNNITENDVRKYYQTSPKEHLLPEAIKAQHIFLEVKKGATPQERAAQKYIATEVLRLASAPDASFMGLIREHSDCTNAKKGCELGTLTREKVAQIFNDKTTFDAEPGTVVGLLESDKGFHIVKVTERIASTMPPYKDVKKSMLTSLEANAKKSALEEMLTELRSAADIVVLERGLPWPSYVRLN